MRIPCNLRTIRKGTLIDGHTLTMRELAARVGIHEQWLGSYERGDMVAGDEELRKLGEFYGVAISAIYPTSVLKVLVADGSRGLKSGEKACPSV